MGYLVGQWGKAPCEAEMGRQAVHVEEVARKVQDRLLYLSEILQILTD